MDKQTQNQSGNAQAAETQVELKTAFRPSFPNPDVWTDDLVRQRQAEFSAFQKSPEGIAEDKAFDRLLDESLDREAAPKVATPEITQAANPASPAPVAETQVELKTAFRPSFPNPDVWTDDLVRQRQAEFSAFEKSPEGIAEEKAFNKLLDESQDRQTEPNGNGIPMQSLPGKTMLYNDQPGMAGLEVVNSDGSVISFGGKPAIEQYAHDNKISPEDLVKMLEIDGRADKYRNIPPEATVEKMSIDPVALERVALARSLDTTQAREAIGLNSVEPNLEKQQLQLASEEESKRSAWLKKAEQPVVNQPAHSDNQVESDEIFTARQQDIKPLVPAEVEKQYLRVGDKFYHPNNADSVAFEDKGNKLETKSDSGSTAISMVRIAEARGWDEIKVSGSETFRKEVWLQAASRGMHIKGYTPSEQDKAELAKRSPQTASNKVENEAKPFRARENELTQKSTPLQSASTQQELRNSQMAQAFAKESPAEAVKKYPELAGAAASVAVIDKQVKADGLTAQQRAVVMARVHQNVINSIERGNPPEVRMKETIEVEKERVADKEYVR